MVLNSTVDLSLPPILPATHENTIINENGEISSENHIQETNDIRYILQNNTDINICNGLKSYYSIDEFNKLKNIRNELTIISLNINSLNEYSGMLNVFINSLKYEPDVIILQETREQIEHILNENFDRYNYFIRYPTGSKCGGVVIPIS